MKKVLKDRCRHPLSFIVFILIILAAVITVGAMLFIVAYILIKGIPHLSLEMFEFTYNSENLSMMPAIINTLIMTVLTLIIAVPVGILSAVYLVSVIRITTETLSGIPSIVFGLFGYLAFVIATGWRNSLIAGALTLAIMVLPTIIRTTEEALIAVPDSYREGSYGLGAGKLRTIFKIVLPSAVPGILSGVILSIGRIVGETAALIFTSGTVAAVPQKLTDSARTLAVHMYCLMTEGLYTGQAYATAVILIVMVLIINGLSGLIAHKIAKR